MTTDVMLDADTVVTHLIRRGVLPSGSERTANARALGGGVSNVVLLVDTEDVSLVVKQSLATLKVASPWYAAPGRVLTEAAALQVAERLIPGTVPTVVDVDAGEHAITLSAAPALGNWKDELLTGRVDLALVGQLGVWLGHWHGRSASLPEVDLAPFTDLEPLRELRLDPYFRAAAEREPSLALDLLDVVAHLERTQVCLVHGDFSPKNVLTGAGRPWVIDFEVAHRGDPGFDVAFMLSHLLMKAIHLPAARAQLAVAAQTFHRAYRRVLPSHVMSTDPELLSRLTGALLVARVHGKSTAGYLTTEQVSTVARLGRVLLTEPGQAHAHDWRNLDLG